MGNTVCFQLRVCWGMGMVSTFCTYRHTLPLMGVLWFCLLTPDGVKDCKSLPKWCGGHHRRLRGGHDDDHAGGITNDGMEGITDNYAGVITDVCQVHLPCTAYAVSLPGRDQHG